MDELEPIHFSNESKKNLMSYVIFTIFAIPAIGSLMLGIYLSSLNNEWWLMLGFLFFSFVLGFFAYVFYLSERKVVYSYTVTEEGIYQKWKNKRTGQTDENEIKFKGVHKVLIGLYADRIPAQRKSFYRVSAILIIMHKDGYFFERFLSANDLKEWIKRMKKNVSSIVYT